MNTPAHLLIGAAAFGKKDRKGTTAAAFFGALAPDLSLYLMVSVSIWIMNIPAERVFRDLYYSDAWQAVFAVDNSFILWGIGLATALWLKSARGVAFAAAGFLHLALDFPLHTHDARMHFWPVSSWVFESPVSYWDSRAHANVVGPIEVMLSLVAVVVLWRRFRALWFRLFVALLMCFELMSSGIWRFVF